MSLDPELLSGNLHKRIGKSRNNTFSCTMGCTWGFREQVEHTFGRLQLHTLSGHPDDFLHTPLQLRVQSEDAHPREDACRKPQAGNAGSESGHCVKETTRCPQEHPR